MKREDPVNVAYFEAWTNGVKHTVVNSLMVDSREWVAIDPEDREEVERLADLIEPCGNLTHCEPGQCGSMECWAGRLQAALREFANPTPKREWRDGDVVQHVNGNYTAQRHDGKWFTTSGSGSSSWGSDEYVTNHVEAGQLRVLREQAAEVTP